MFLETVRGEKFIHAPISYSKFRAIVDCPHPKMAAKPEARQAERNTPGMMARLASPCALALMNRTVPADVRDDAERHSRALVFNLSALVSRIRRDQAHGSLDSSKLARLARPGIARPEFERLAATAYRRREQRETQRRPRVAIVADMCWDLRRDIPTYNANVSRLAYVISEACKIAGMDVALYLSRGGVYKHKDRVPGVPSFARNGHIPAIAKDWHEEIDGPCYALFNSNDSFVSALQLSVSQAKPYGEGVGSKNGTGGIEFARMQGADFVIAIGNFAGDDAPDCSISAKSSADQMVALASEAFRAYSARH